MAARDYNLGRAFGRIVIGADTRGADEATRAMGRAQRGAEDLTDSTGRLAEVEARRNNLQEEYNQVANRRTDAENEYRRILRDETATVEQVNRAEQTRNQIRGEALQTARRLRSAERELVDITNEGADAHRGLGREARNSANATREFAQDLDRANRMAGNLANTLTNTLLTAFKTVGLIGGAGIAGGALGGAAGGGLAGLTSGMLGAVEIVKQFSGILLLLPAVISGAGASLAVLAVGFQGVSDAIGAFDDPKKFSEAISKMAPATRQVLVMLQSFRDAFKGAMQEVQQALWAPIVDMVEPLVRTWLPALMRGGQQLAGVFGQAGRAFMEWMLQPQVMQAFEEFIGNLTRSMTIMLPAIDAISDAWLTLTRVGGQAFPQIAQAITEIALAFNAWVQDSAANGKLFEWIQTAINAFKQTWEIVTNVGNALGNIGAIADNWGGGFLSVLVRITEQFSAWTESVEGQAAIGQFFELLSDTGDAFLPVLKALGGALGIFITSLMQMGGSIAPGLASFFESLGEAIGILGAAFVDSGPAFNQFLTDFGSFLTEVMSEVGPQLPEIFATLADVLSALAPTLVTVGKSVAEFLAGLSPEQVMAIAGIATALWGIVTVGTALAGLIPAVAALFAIFSNPIVLGVVAIAALVAGLVLAYQNIEGFRNAVDKTIDVVGQFLSKTHELATAGFGVLVQGVKNAITAIGNLGTSFKDAISSWFKNIFGEGSFVNDAFEWGRSIISKLIDGMASMLGNVGTIAGRIAQVIKDFFKTGSPTKLGPLSEVSPEDMGSKFVGDYAKGVGSGKNEVAQASGEVLGGMGFTSAGGSYKSGSGQEQSGMNAWVKNLTADMSAWANIIRSSFSIFEGVTNMVVEATKIVASVWNKGDNPLTREGGLFGPPAQPQNDVDGVPSAAPPPGKAPYPEMAGDFGQGTGDASEQRQVDGVPSAESGAKQIPAPPKGAWWTEETIGAKNAGRDPNEAAAVPYTPASSSSAPVGDAALPKGWESSQQEVANAIYAEGKKRGWSDEKIQQAMGTAYQESHLGAASKADGSDPRIPKGVPNGGFQPGPEGVGPMGEFGDFALGYFQQKPRYYPDWDSPMGNIRGFMDNVDNAGGDIIGVQKGIYGMDEVNGNINAIMDNFNAAKAAGGVNPGAPSAPAGPPKRTVDVSEYGGINLLDDPEVSLGGGPNAQRERRGYAPVGTPSGARLGNEEYGLAPGTDTGGYGSGNAEDFPPWVIALGERFGLKPSTYGEHQEDGASGRTDGNIPVAPNPEGLNRGIDWAAPGDPKEVEKMQAFADFLKQNPGLVEQAIWRNPNNPGEQDVEIGGGKLWPGLYGEGTLNEHDNHVHTRHSRSIELGQGGTNIPEQNLFGQGGNIEGKPDPNALLFGDAGKSNQMEQDLLNDIKGNPGKYPLFGPGGQGTNPDTGPQSLQQQLDATHAAASPDSGLSQDVTGGQEQSPMATFESAMGAASSIVGDAFRIFDDVINNINATADLTDRLIRGFENTENVMETIDQVQTFIKTAADVSALVKNSLGLAGGIVGAAAAADPSGGAGAAGGGLMAASAIAGLVQQGFELVNAGIDLAQDVYRITSKYGAIFAGGMLGGPETGPLGGDVRLLLNTRANEIYAYSQQNPDLKETKNLPDWLARSYGGIQPSEPQTPSQLNLYMGPGTDPKEMISNTMWLVNNGAAVTSVSGMD